MNNKEENNHPWDTPRYRDNQKIHGEDIQTIISLREDRMTYADIGGRYGVTRERIRQIIKAKRPDLTGWFTVPKILHTFVCPNLDCGKRFTTHNPIQKYCKNPCRRMYNTREQALNAQRNRANHLYNTDPEYRGRKQRMAHRWWRGLSPERKKVYGDKVRIHQMRAKAKKKS